ncbi:unnamed protein product [Larinioides sclopetarius]|uniref:Major facilitator superfamily (MFS) profile domain-containing protein n=1 Tax=Larinioides sclopetarius TaxID=280406 RepID=A0AAV2BB44_9ARAC
MSAGFLGYVVIQIPAGLIAEAYGAKNVYLSGVLIASLARIFCPLAAWHDCYLMIAIQLLRGMGQGLHSPANSVITTKWFPKQERGFFNAIIFSGSAVGSFISYATAGAMCTSALFGGWPSVYFIHVVANALERDSYIYPSLCDDLFDILLFLDHDSSNVRASTFSGTHFALPHTNGSLGYSLGLPGMYIVGCDKVWNNICSIIAFSFAGLSLAGCLLVPSDMSPTFAGNLFAFSNTIAGTATFIFPIIVGLMTDTEFLDNK